LKLALIQVPPKITESEEFIVLKLPPPIKELVSALLKQIVFVEPPPIVEFGDKVELLFPPRDAEQFPEEILLFPHLNVEQVPLPNTSTDSPKYGHKFVIVKVPVVVIGFVDEETTDIPKPPHIPKDITPQVEQPPLPPLADELLIPKLLLFNAIFLY
jgi:hypothetical protein